MKALKAYCLDSHTSVTREIHALLNLPKHVTQADVIIFAASKAAASGWSAVAYGQPLPARSFEVATGSVVDALVDALLNQEPSVYVTPLLARHRSPVVRARAAGPELAGHLRAHGYDRGSPRYLFIHVP